MSEELKPCPFCGSSDVFANADLMAGFCVVCCVEDCEAQGPFTDTKEQAIAAWNKRAGG